MPTFAIYLTAAAAEIAGCYALWVVVRQDVSRLWLIPGILSLVLFGWLLTKVDVETAGRAYAVYGGIYIVASLVWLWAVEGHLPDRWDILGAFVCLIGAMIILYVPRTV